jgi:hypothetical protein
VPKFEQLERLIDFNRTFAYNWTMTERESHEEQGRQDSPFDETEGLLTDEQDLGDLIDSHDRLSLDELTASIN